MPYAVLSDKVVNNNTRVDISVPSYKEIEGPLGGMSVEYVILVVAERKMLDINCTSNDIIEYKTLKSYRECEDFYTKFCNKYSTTPFPELPKMFSHPCTSPEDRQAALDQVLNFISSTSQICSSPQLLSFLGIEFTNGTQIVLNTAEKQEHSTDDNTIFKKVKIKQKNSQVSENNNDNSNLTSNVTSENESFETLDEDFDEIFKEPVVRKRNETGSKPLFDELSLIKRSEKFQQEPLLFDPKDYGGPIGSNEADLFLIPGAKEITDAHDSVDDTEDTLALLSVHDDLDQFLAKVNKPYSTNASSTSKLTNVATSSNQTSTRPVPPPKPSVPTKISQSFPVSESVAEAKVETSERPGMKPLMKASIPMRPIPAARNRASRPVPQPRKNIETNNANKDHLSEEKASIESVDILKYIEDEQKNANSEPDLFS